MDENLFYKGVNKDEIEKSRKSQSIPSGSTSVAKPGEESGANIVHSTSSDNPPYLFDSGASLLRLTEDHGVCSSLPYKRQDLTPNLDDNRATSL